MLPQDSSSNNSNLDDLISLLKKLNDDISDDQTYDSEMFLIDEDGNKVIL